MKTHLLGVRLSGGSTRVGLSNDSVFGLLKVSLLGIRLESGSSLVTERLPLLRGVGVISLGQLDDVEDG